MDKIIVYTCITNGKDTLKDYADEEGIRYMCFNDGTIDITGNWEDCGLAESDQTDPRRIARYHKLNPSIVLPEHKWNIWIDGSLIPRVRINDLVNLVKSKPNGCYCVRPHPGWNCIYKEAKAIAHYGFEDEKLLDKIINKYELEGFPKEFGMHETGVLVRENIQPVIEFDKQWWNEVKSNSKRDQMSFDYVRWKNKRHMFELNKGWFCQDPNQSFFGHKHGE